MSKCYIIPLLDELERRKLASYMTSDATNALLEQPHIQIICIGNQTLFSTQGYDKLDIIDILSAIIEGLDD